MTQAGEGPLVIPTSYWWGGGSVLQVASGSVIPWQQSLPSGTKASSPWRWWVSSSTLGWEGLVSPSSAGLLRMILADNDGKGSHPCEVYLN